MQGLTFYTHPVYSSLQSVLGCGLLDTLRGPTNNDVFQNVGPWDEGRHMFQVSMSSFLEVLQRVFIEMW